MIWAKLKWLKEESIVSFHDDNRHIANIRTFGYNTGSQTLLAYHILTGSAKGNCVKHARAKRIGSLLN
jgi:hypothetical protein